MGDDDPSETVFVLIEFTGVAREYDFRPVAARVPAASVLAVDPLDVPGSARSSNQDRARAVTGQILATGASRAVIVASCTGAVMIGHIRAQLEAEQMTVLGAAALDPVRVCADVVNDALREMADGLGCALPDGLRFGAGGLGADSADSAGQAEGMLRAWADDYFAELAAEDLELREVLTELQDRYASWVSFLISALTEPAAALDREIDAFGSAERLAGSTAEIELSARQLRLYETRGGSCLSASQCARDLLSWSRELLSSLRTAVPVPVAAAIGVPPSPAGAAAASSGRGDRPVRPASRRGKMVR
jgi:hypothetical protein